MGDIKQDIRDLFYAHVHIQHRGDNEPRWRGVHMIKFPTDMALYAEAIWENKPDYLIETGTKFGGSALFFADMLQLFSGGKVISIDIAPESCPAHPGVEYIVGSSSDRAIFEQVKRRVEGKKVMVVLDSDHRSFHVKRELRLLGRLVTKGQFLVVEDSYTRNSGLKGAGRAVEWYLTTTDKYKRETPEDKYFVAVTRGGWLRRVR